jgi:hypothetical protein
MTVLLQRPGRRSAALAREAQALLAKAGAGEGEWTLLDGADLLAGPPLTTPGLVLLPRRDPRWSLEDMAHRPLDRLPAGTRVVVPSDLGAALLARARPDLVAVRAGSFPVPEETPVLAEGPFDGNPAGEPLDPRAFLPAPGTGLWALLGPESARALADGDARIAVAIERGLVAGAGTLPPGASLGAHARRKASILWHLRAALFRPGEAPREVSVDIPLEGAGTFARGFGRHLAGG